MEVVDIHQHIGGLGGSIASVGSAAPEPSLEETAAQRVAAMDAAGIDWSLIQPSHMYLKADGIRDTMRVNETVAEMQKLRPERFRLAVGTVEPMHGDRSLDEITRCKQQLGLQGLSWHHRFQGCYLDSPLMRPILARVDELGLVPVFHTNAASQFEAPWRLQRLAVEFPQLTFLALDAFHTLEVGESALFIAEQTPNIIWDLSGPIMLWNTGWHMVQRWIRRHGGERLAFGADLAYGGGAGRRSQLLETILASPIGDEAKTQILGGNVRRAFAAHLKG